MNRLARFRNSLVYESKVFKKFVKQNGLNFDIIIAEEFYQESFLMFAHKYKAPIVALCKYFYVNEVHFMAFIVINWIFFFQGSFGGASYIDHQHGLFTPPSFVPHFVSIQY